MLSWPGFYFFLCGSDGKESTCNAGDLDSIPGLGEISWRRAWQPTPVFLPEESYGQRSLEGYLPWGHKESDVTERLSTAQHFVLCVCMLSHFSRVRLCVTPWKGAHQAALSMGFSRPESGHGLPLPSPGDLPDPGIGPAVLRSPGRRVL